MRMEKTSRILILNGPNLNLLGQREPEIYGSTTLAEIERQCRALVAQNAEIDFRQSNNEGELINWIQQASGGFGVIVINAAAYTHSSVAIHDALKSYTGRVIEVHLSNPHAREVFRHQSYISPVAEAVIAGCGVQSYLLALRYVLEGENDQ